MNIARSVWETKNVVVTQSVGKIEERNESMKALACRL